MQQQQQPTAGADTRSPRGGLKDAVGGVVDGGRSAPGPAEGLSASAGAMGASNGVKESSGVNGSGGPPPSKRQVGSFLSCLSFGELWECVFFYCRRRMKVLLLWRLGRGRELAGGRAVRGDRVLPPEGLVLRARVRRGRRVWAVMRRRRQSGGGGRWVGAGGFLFFSSLLTGTCRSQNAM